MATFDMKAFATFLKANVSKSPFGEGACAKHVRLALAAGGLKPATWPVAAKDWSPTLMALGFKALPANGHLPAKLGDIAVIQTTSESKYGHIEGYDGSNWISDFAQREFWPGPSFRSETPAFMVYRWPV